MEPKNIKEFTDKERYDYFIEQALEHQEVWLLQAQDGLYAMFEDDEAKQYIPVWPANEFSSFYATGDWEGYQSERMSLREFIDWMQELRDDQIFIGVFPDESMHAMATDPIALKKQLKQGLKQI
jgi:hypothetical protein